MEAMSVFERLAERTNAQILDKIIEGTHIIPVYQPIVSLTDGETFGYEALSRISEDSLKMNIEEMFKTADRTNRAWELETLCRVKALKGAAGMSREKKLFLNVNSNIIHDDSFKNGFTKSRLEKSVIVQGPGGLWQSQDASFLLMKGLRRFMRYCG